MRPTAAFSGQVPLRKRLDVEGADQRWHGHLPRLMVEAWPQPAGTAA